MLLRNQAQSGQTFEAQGEILVLSHHLEGLHQLRSVEVALRMTFSLLVTLCCFTGALLGLLGNVNFGNSSALLIGFHAFVSMLCNFFVQGGRDSSPSEACTLLPCEKYRCLWLLMLRWRSAVSLLARLTFGT